MEFFRNFDAYRDGMWITVQLTVISFVLGLAIGCVLAVFRVGPVPPLRALGTTYVELLRNTPLLVLLILLFFGVNQLGFQYSPFATALIGLSLYVGAYAAEIVRSGLNAVPMGQAEAARAIGLGYSQVIASVVLPQAVRTVVAPLGSLFLAMIRNSALASAISVNEIVRVGDNVVAPAIGDNFAAVIGAGVAYLFLTIPTAVGVKVLERRTAFAR